MAFNVQAIVGSTTISLYDGSPFTLRNARGMGGADVRRVTTQGPAQHGDTDKGYRLQPREIELVIGFRATTDTILDGYRDTLMGVFKPLSSTPVNLRVTRDDGEIRQIDCYTIGDVKIVLNVPHRPGHYHEATVRLRAADPAWYELAPGTVTTTGTAALAANWWLAGGAIGTAQVLMSGGTPAQGATWTYAGTIAASTGYTIAFRSGQETLTGTPKYAFYVDTSDAVDVAVGGVSTYNSGGSNNYTLGSTYMTAGTHNYFVRHDPTGVFDDLPLVYKEVYYRGDGATLTGFVPSYPGTTSLPLSGSTRRWRSDAGNNASSRWTSAIPLYAVYSPDLTLSQMSALSLYMDGAIGGTVAQSVAVPYEGDLPEYPTISLRGPITGAVITNTATGETLSFGTVAIAAGATYVINTNPLYRTVLSGTVNKRGELTPASQLGEWHLAPNPVASGGTNVIGVTGTSAGTATQISIVYYNRFSSY